MEPLLALERPPRRRIFAYGGLAVWAVVCVLFGGALMVDHLVALPAPAATDAALHQMIATQRRADQRGRWLVLHVIAESCGCSRRVLDHLLADPRPGDVAERVVFITEQPATAATTLAAIRARGFDLDVVTPDELGARYHIEAAPLLVVVDPGDRVRYVGGYTPRKQAADVRDLAMIAAVRRGEIVTPLPAFGCAIGRALRSKLDPLGIRN